MFEEEELDRVTLTDEDGNTFTCVVLARLEVAGKQYAIVIDDEDEDGDAGVLRIEVGEDGEEQWVSVEDDDEFDAVVDAWELVDPMALDDENEELDLEELEDEDWEDEDEEDEDKDEDKDDDPRAH
jgi:uncharacterized protein YrzB (UPF0473 family)